MDTRWSARAASGAGNPHASLPITHAWGSVRAPRPVSASSCRTSSPVSPSTVVARVRTPAWWHAVSTSSSATPVTTGTWNRLPAVERTTLGAWTSTEPVVSTTASAPAASAARTTVPALPGSRTWASTSRVRGWEPRTCSKATSTTCATARTGWGVTASAITAMTSAEAVRTCTRAAAAARA